MKYSGITPDSLYLLSENRFNNSRAFYNAHKGEIKRGVTDQMAYLIEDLSDLLRGINPDFILEPHRCICRVYRDNRFTNDKSLYRENLWAMFRHQKNHLPTPMLWFEFSQLGVDYGVALISSTPALMEFWRKKLLQNADLVSAAADKMLKAKMHLDDDRYKRSKAECTGFTGIMRDLYDSKFICLRDHTDSTDILTKPAAFEKRLSEVYTASADFYGFLLDISTEYNSSNIAR